MLVRRFCRPQIWDGVSTFVCETTRYFWWEVRTYSSRVCAIREPSHRDQMFPVNHRYVSPHVCNTCQLTFTLHVCYWTLISGGGRETRSWPQAGLCFSVCTCELAGCLLETFSSRVCGDRTWCFSRWRVFTYLRYNRLCELLIIFHLFISGWCSLQPQRASDGRHLYLSSYSEDFVLIKDVNNVWTGYSKSPATSVVREKTVQWTMKLPSSLFCLVLIFHISTRVNLSLK